MEKLGAIIFKAVGHHEECDYIMNKGDFCTCDSASTIHDIYEAVKARDKFVLGEDEKSGECLCVKYKRAEESL